ncbi:hypothetical protein LAZ67_18001732 [Cordylochernes scorpioides]|uniref:Transposase n=1 Tax=Cordylochernes scorpioides TaxID=51811 RepID=A0ABY6LFZ6_9ARAC|nr:hypothetical protein LAZ67_18001732 [Cordylochernes scorpioides]
MPGHRKRRQFKQTDAFTRGMVIGLKRAGWSIRQIAADTHLGASTVHRLWRRWLEQGNVAIYRNVGATRVTSARVDRRILRQAVAAPQATCTAILQHVQDTLDHSISTRTISRRLVANGLHSCRPLRRLPLTPPNRRQRLEWCRARSTWMTEWHRVVFSDESRFCLSSDSRRVRVWRRRGERSNPAAIVERPTVRQRGIMVWGAIAYDSRSPLLRIQGTMTAQRYVDDVLRPVTLPYLQGVPNALYQQDNARPHTARISQQALQDVQMLPWPPYSPDLSPIEHVWDIIGRRLHALPQPRSEDELWQMVEREWRAIPQDAIRTLIDSLPRRVAACIAVRATNSQKFLYADDIALLHQEQSFSTLEQILNEDLKKLENFFSKWHLIPNPSKTVSSVFHLNNHKANRPLKLTFCNKPLSHDPCPKYLVVTLDRSLTFRQHLEKTRDKLKTRNNIMTRLAGTTWGCDADTLRTTALALVYSVAEYCAPVWERSSHTDSIDAQLNQTMRLITGNMRPTPIDWLPYLSNIAPPDLRRKKSTSNLLSKIKANTKLPINTVLEIPPPTRLISRNPAWVADENVDLKEEWRNRWSNLAIANKDLVEDPNTKPPGYNLPRRTWSTLNRIRTSTGRCNYLLNKWNMSPDQNCDCGQIQTMHHILRDCPRRFFQGTLGDIHRCTEEALEWIRHLDIPL